METEEEQVERLKAWLKENGLSIVLGIVIGVGGIGGYNSVKTIKKRKSKKSKKIEQIGGNRAKIENFDFS